MIKKLFNLIRKYKRSGKKISKALDRETPRNYKRFTQLNNQLTQLDKTIQTLRNSK